MTTLRTLVLAASLALVLVPTVARDQEVVADGPTDRKKVCGDWERFTWENQGQKAEALNNMWGKGSANNTDKFQCIIWRDNGQLAFEYSWDGPHEQVKAYPSFINGWHWGNMGSEYGLPRKIGDRYSLNAEVIFTHNPGRSDEIMNFAWDIWIGDSSSMDPNQRPKVEVMVWPWHLRQYPIGQKRAEVRFWNIDWEVWYGTTEWKVISFVAKSNVQAPRGNLRDFFDWTIQNHGDWLRNDQWVLGVEFGCELLVAKGISTFVKYHFDALQK